MSRDTMPKRSTPPAPHTDVRCDMVNAASGLVAPQPAKPRGPVSPETREKIRQAALGRPVSPETREKMRQANLGKPQGIYALLFGPELADYRVLTSKGQYTRAEALAAIGRADLVSLFAAHKT